MGFLLAVLMSFYDNFFFFTPWWSHFMNRCQVVQYYVTAEQKPMYINSICDFCEFTYDYIYLLVPMLFGYEYFGKFYNIK